MLRIFIELRWLSSPAKPYYSANVSHQNRRSKRWDIEGLYSTLNQTSPQKKRLAIPEGFELNPSE
jgi:hypothetical protein